ncbi:hypothetical protein [Domibacillus tundrae]|uniref:hypothetical protein n=1 Tax=Domibacillus tundrae TaxID=1587527 RepID=UPI0033907F7F
MSQPAAPFNESQVHYSNGWHWGDEKYWGEAGEIIGILPDNIVMGLPHDKRSTEYWFYFAAISRSITSAFIGNGKRELTSDDERRCNAQAKELMKDSIENKTPVKMLLAKYEVIDPYRPPDLSGLQVVECLPVIREGH